MSRNGFGGLATKRAHPSIQRGRQYDLYPPGASRTRDLAAATYSPCHVSCGHAPHALQCRRRRMAHIIAVSVVVTAKRKTASQTRLPQSLGSAVQRDQIPMARTSHVPPTKPNPTTTLIRMMGPPRAPT